MIELDLPLFSNSLQTTGVTVKKGDMILFGTKNKMNKLLMNLMMEALVTGLNYGFLYFSGQGVQERSAVLGKMLGQHRNHIW